VGQQEETVLLLVCGEGMALDNHLYLAPQNMRLGSGDVEKGFSRAGVRWRRTRGLLAGLLLDSGSAEASGAMAVMDWFSAAAERAGPVMERLRLDPLRLQHSTRLKSFPLLAAVK
jgi:hypothetical protein